MHMLKEESISGDRKDTTNAGVRTAGEPYLIAGRDGNSDVRLSDRSGTVKMNHVLYVSKVAYK